ncbi:MAG: DUF924 domain-containing protein [Alphaproteobacteria bacterium]|nr:DUF924 domain-containing protein [Alphaproteobacteria bacterium]
MKDYHHIITFWFETLQPKDWFMQSDETDKKIEDFVAMHAQARAGELAQWRDKPQGRLAEIIILDQFSRNLFRNTKDAFAYDVLALILAQTAISVGADKELSKAERLFCYMPFMHSESKLIQQQSMELFTALQMEDPLKFAQEHHDIIMRFGRYPHRNSILGRVSSAEELEFLKEHSGF